MQRVWEVPETGERMLTRMFRVAGVRLRFNALLRDMNVEVAASGARHVEVLKDLHIKGRSHLAVDVTLRSALGVLEPQSGAADTDGGVLLQARRDMDTPRTGGVQPMQTCSGGLGNWRQVE